MVWRALYVTIILSIGWTYNANLASIFSLFVNIM